MPSWPPDVFCICAAVLQFSGAYSRVTSDSVPHRLIKESSGDRELRIRDIGHKWKEVALSSTTLPSEVVSWWKLLIDHSETPLYEVASNDKCCLALINLLSAADAACGNLGFETPSFKKKKKKTSTEAFIARGDSFLSYSPESSDVCATLCKEIHPSKGIVLPKMHTAQNGLTIRSLSHHLAYCSAPSVRPYWLNACPKSDGLGLNLLIIPWPYTVEPKQFIASRSCLGDRISPRSHGLFTYKPSPGPTVQFVGKLLKKAESEHGPVHGIVFPELSMTFSEYDKLSKTFVTSNRFLLAGVGEAAPDGARCGKNYAVWDIGVEIDGVHIRASFRQEKHHRWKLDRSQIFQYDIASRLHPSASWWEHIEIGERTLAFATIRKWLCLSVLICEDLARPDPVGDVLRSVGPNLIIALLSDGPQLVGRWPGRYAGAFADDPGSSVLTVTSAGMARLSRPSDGKISKSDVVALWRDARTGTKEIPLPENSSGLVLHLSVDYDTEWTADGRGDGNWSAYPTLSSVHGI